MKKLFKDILCEVNITCSFMPMAFLMACDVEIDRVVEKEPFPVLLCDSFVTRLENKIKQNYIVEGFVSLKFDKRSTFKTRLLII